MRKLTIIFGIFIFVTICLVILILIIQSFNPLCRPNKYIRNDILKDIPFGTDIISAEKIIKEKMLSYNIDLENGYGILNETPYIDIGKKVCEKRIIVYLGSYHTFFVTTDVEAFLGFDNEGFLVNVSIRKTHDSL